MTWIEFERRRQETDTVIIPTGACEIYGAHLPMGSDGFAAMSVSEKIAEKTGALIAPMLEVAECRSLLSYSGTLTISNELFTMYIRELMDNLVRYDFRNFMFISGHGANIAPVSYVAQDYQLKCGIKWAQIDLWRFFNIHGDNIFDNKGIMAHGHASECSTSVMLYLRPELVDMAAATRVEPTADALAYTDVIRFIPMDEKSPNGTVGDATAGTAEKGKAIIDKCVNRIADFMKDNWKI